MITTHLRRGLAALAACAAALTGVAFATTSAHAAPGLLVEAGGRPMIVGQQYAISAADLPADATRVQIVLGYSHDGGGSQGVSLSTEATADALGLLHETVTIPADLPPEYLARTNATHDYITVQTSDDKLVGRTDVRVLASAPTISLSTQTASAGDTAHIHGSGWQAGEQVHVRVETSDPHSGASPRLATTSADRNGVIDTDVTLESAYAGFMLDSASTYLEASSDDNLARADAPLRITAPTPPSSSCPRPTAPGGPVICLYAPANGYSGHPGDVAYAAGYRWLPGSTVALYATQGCTIDQPGVTPDDAACTINGGLGIWDAGTDAVKIASVAVSADGAIDPQAVTLPELPDSWYTHQVAIVAIGPHTSAYRFAGDGMGTESNGFVWLPASTPTDPTPTPTDPTTPTPPAMSGKPTPVTTPTPVKSTPNKPSKNTPTPSTVTDPPRRSSKPTPTPSTSTTPHPPRNTPTPTPSTGTPTHRPLASTGVHTRALVGVGAALVALGFLIVYLARRPRGEVPSGRS